jgi:uncharacterized glyoxalase superfamily protein PhnB
MSRSVTPMIHVVDVLKTTRWYESIGFTLLDIVEDDGQAVWAVVSFGRGRVMFNAGGRASKADRREVDLYVDTEAVDQLYGTLKGRVEVREEPHDTFYGMREFVIRDINGFWLTFGEPISKVGLAKRG